MGPLPTLGGITKREGAHLRVPLCPEGHSLRYLKARKYRPEGIQVGPLPSLGGGAHLRVPFYNAQIQIQGHLIQVGPLPSLGVQEGPTCEYLNFMPRYRGIQVGPLPRGPDTEGPTCEYLQVPSSTFI